MRVSLKHLSPPLNLAMTLLAICHSWIPQSDPHKDNLPVTLYCLTNAKQLEVEPVSVFTPFGDVSTTEKYSMGATNRAFIFHSP